MGHRHCPWWLGYVLASPVRRLWQDPRTILRPLVTDGMTVLEPGPGMGFFTVELARLVGPSGRVVAIDVEPRMLKTLGRRVTRAQIAERVHIRQAQPDRMGTDDLQGAVDFVLAFAVAHEMPDQAAFFAEAARALKPGGEMLLAEPIGHVSEQEFVKALAHAAQAGLLAGSHPYIRASHTALLVKPAETHKDT